MMTIELYYNIINERNLPLSSPICKDRKSWESGFGSLTRQETAI